MVTDPLPETDNSFKSCDYDDNNKSQENFHQQVYRQPLDYYWSTIHTHPHTISLLIKDMWFGIF